MESVETTKTTTVEHPETVIKTVKQTVPPAVKTEHPQVVYQKKKAIFRTYQIVWFILGAIEILLGFRMTLKALGANPTSGFASLIYGISEPLAMPFQGILRTNVTGGSVFEWSTLIAAVVYAIIALGIIQVMQMFKPVTPEEVETNVDTA